MDLPLNGRHPGIGWRLDYFLVSGTYEAQIFNSPSTTRCRVPTTARCRYSLIYNWRNLMKKQVLFLCTGN